MESIGNFIAACAYNPDNADNNDNNFDACLKNIVKEVLVRKLISDGVDINAQQGGFTGLIMAMSVGNLEVVKILLGSKNIKIDLKNKNGWTALHFACLTNQVEGVKLFLAHPTCNKDIVRIGDEYGATAEMIADMRGNKECSKLVREFTAAVNEDGRSVDDLVEFITGGETEKKKKKKRRNPVQSTSPENTGNNIKTGNTGGNGVNTEIGMKNNVGKGYDDNIMKVDTMKHSELKKAKEELEQKIVETSAHFDAHEQKVNNIIYANAVEIQNLSLMIAKSQDEKSMKVNEVAKLDKALSDLETKMAELKLKKVKLLEESKKDDEMIQKYEDNKLKLCDNFEREMRINKENGNTIKKEIQNLKSKLQETAKLIKTLPNDDNKLLCEPSKEFLKFIECQISEKEQELECPVCLEVACSPIFMCSEQHLICSTCRPKLSNCPECRVVYKGKNRRHRYAEKTAEELERLKNKKDQVRKYYSSVK